MEARLLSGGEGKEDTGELVTTEAGGGVGANSWLSVCTYDVHVSSAREHYRCVLSCSCLLALCISSPPHFSPPPILPHWRSRKAKECTRESVPHTHLWECVPGVCPHGHVPTLAAIHTSAYNTSVAF